MFFFKTEPEHTYFVQNTEFHHKVIKKRVELGVGRARGARKKTFILNGKLKQEKPEIDDFEEKK